MTSPRDVRSGPTQAALRLIPPLPRCFPGKLQDLDPESARLVLQVERLLLEYAEPDLAHSGVLAAVSGGTDSLALLLILTLLRERLQFRLKACHLNHGLRPAAAAEQVWVADFCSRLGVEFHGRVVDVAALAAQKRMGLEEAGRDARLAMFRELTASVGGFVATGHTLNDLAEDVLMRLLRGSGWPALAGMDRFNAESGIWRPLLFIERRELAAFLERLNIPHLEDESNQTPDFLRNRLRLEAVPLLLRENPGWLDQVRSLKRLAETDAAYWRAEMEKHPLLVFAPGKAEGAPAGHDPAQRTVFLGREQLHNAPQALRLRLFMRCARALGGGQALADNLLALDRAWSGDGAGPRGGKVIQLPGKTAARTTRDGIWFYFQR